MLFQFKGTTPLNIRGTIEISHTVKKNSFSNFFPVIYHTRSTISHYERSYVLCELFRSVKLILLPLVVVMEACSGL